MQDLACDDFKKCRGIARVSSISHLKNFRQPKNAAELRADCRVQNAILYYPAYEFDAGVCKDISRRSGAVAFALCDVLREEGFRRAIVISKMRLALAAFRKSGCGYFACTLAKNEGELRNARELEAFMGVLGMDGHEIRFAKQTAQKLFMVRKK